MGKYKVLIYPLAQSDLEEIVDYLNTLSPQSAIKNYNQLIDQIASLAVMPDRCPMVKDIILKAKGYRFLIVNNYLVFFVVQGNSVQIRRIIYGKRNYDWIL